MYTQAMLGSLLLKSISLHNNITYFYGNLYCVTVTYYSIINVASNNITDYIAPPPPQTASKLRSSGKFNLPKGEHRHSF